MLARSVKRLLLFAWLGLVAGCHNNPPVPPAPTTVGVTKPNAPEGQSQKDAMPDGWKTFVAEDGSFSISIPGTPTKESVQSTSPFGPVTVTIYSLQTSIPNYFVGSTEYPADKITPESAEPLLQKTVESMRGKPGVTIVSEKKISLNGSPGRDMVMRNQDTSELRQIFYLVKNRMYVMNAEYPLGKDYSKERDRFLDSFKLLPPAQK